MLQDIRKSTQGTAAKIIIGLIVISFSIFGIESILLGGGDNSVAEVNGEGISPQEVQQVVNTMQRRLLAMMGENIDPSMLDDQRLTAQAIESLVQQKLLLQSAEGLDLTVSEAQLGQMIAGMDQFQLEGQFSPEVYRSVLASAGYSPAFFKQSLAQDVMINHLRSGLAGSEFVTPTELSLAARIAGEQRDLRYLTIVLDEAAAEVDVSDEQVQAYYDENIDRFMSAESVELDYVELRPEQFFELVAEEDLQAEYELTLQDYQYATERRVSHILIEDSEESRIAEVQAALAEGGDFAELAKTYSDDVGSAGFGGDLGFTTGDAFPPEMEEAIAALELNAISGSVVTDAGTHIIQLTELREGEAPPLEELRAQLERQVQEREGAARLVSAVEQLRDLSFNADTLDAPAQELGLSVQQTGPVTRDHNEGLFANPQLIAAAFSDDVLQGGHNSEVIELAGESFVALRVRLHNEPAQRPLADVRGEIEQALAAEAAREAVAAQADNALDQLRAGESVESIALANGWEWQVDLGASRGANALPPEVLNRAFELPAPTGDEAVYEYVMTAAGDALVFEVSRVEPGDLDQLPVDQSQLLRRQLGVEGSQLLDAEYATGLRDKAEISVL